MDNFGFIDVIPVTAAPTALDNIDDIDLFIDANGASLTGDPFPNWGEWQTSSVSAVDFGGVVGDVLKFNTVNVQGVNLDDVDASGASSLTLDVWSETAGKVKLFLISGAVAQAPVEYGEIFDVTAGAWNTIGIDMANVTGTDLAAIDRLKFDTQANAGGVGEGETGLSTFYVDNFGFIV